MKQMVESFSEREVEVLYGLAEGLSNYEIADRLFLSPSTVKWYVRQLNSKLDTSNREEIVERAEGMGLLNSDKPITAPVLHNLPYQTTPFVGREAELDELTTMLNNPEIRLLTILAQGGMGKTRIAIEAAEQQLNHFPNGVFFVPFQALSEISQILPHLANSVCYQISANDKRSDKEQVLEFFANKKLLLLMDNLEHLLDGIDIISEILQAAPNVKVLTTSREKLKLSGETVYLLRGMAFPAWESPADVLCYDAVRLLHQAAKRIKPDWEITEANLEFVSRICRLTEGMPLGILLAVAWLDVLTLDEIAAEIQKNVDFLETDMRDVPERQRSVRAIFETAWKRLELLEQQIFMKMAVFRGGCTRQAAEAITGASLRSLQSLVNKALISRSQDERFEIHELLRQYAEIELKKAEQAQSARNDHATFYAELLDNRENWLKGGKQLEALKDIETDFENVRTAWSWVIEQGNWTILDQMLASLAMFCLCTGQAGLGYTLFGMALEQLSPEGGLEKRRVWGRIFVRQTSCDFRLGDEKTLEIALKIAYETANGSEIAYCLWIIARVCKDSAQFERSRELATEALAVARSNNDYHNELLALWTLCDLAFDKDQDAKADLELIEEGLRRAREVNDIRALSSFLNINSFRSIMMQDYENAGKFAEESLTLNRMLGLHSSIANTLSNLSFLYCEQGRFELAEAYACELMAEGQHLNHLDYIGLAQQAMRDIRIYQGNFVDALSYSDELYKLWPEVATDPRDTSHLNLILSIIRCGLVEYEEATHLLYSSLEELVKGSVSFTYTRTIFAMALVLAYYEKLSERALELMSLLAHHRATTFWRVHPLIPPLLEHLKNTLSSEDYYIVWERGKQLDIIDTMKQLVDQYASK